MVLKKEYHKQSSKKVKIYQFIRPIKRHLISFLKLKNCLKVLEYGKILRQFLKKLK